MNLFFSYQHKDMLSSYGLSEDTNFPTAAFLPVKDRDDDLVTTVNNFHSNVIKSYVFEDKQYL